MFLFIVVCFICSFVYRNIICVKGLIHEWRKNGKRVLFVKKRRKQPKKIRNFAGDNRIIIMTNKRKVTVVIPIYRTDMSEVERWTVQHNLSVLNSGRDITLVCPDGLDLSQIADMFGLSTGRCRVERFHPSFFAGRIGYNRLMLNREFYSRFKTSEYVLICQTDAALLRDDIDHWCSLAFDYIGAPWLPAFADIKGFNIIRRAVFWLRKEWAKKRGGFHPVTLKWKVGNGGLSLRKVATMLRVIGNHEKELTEIAVRSNNSEFFEDVVWSVRVNEIFDEHLHIPDAATAALFSVEGHPDTAMRLTGGQLPMGTHAFFRSRNRAFWRRHLDFPNK